MYGRRRASPDLLSSTCCICSNRADQAAFSGKWGSSRYPDRLNFWPIDKNFWLRPWASAAILFECVGLFFKFWHNVSRHHLIVIVFFMTIVACTSFYLFKCPNTDRCIETIFVCDDNNDCGDWSDEANCAGEHIIVINCCIYSCLLISWPTFTLLSLPLCLECYNRP